MSSKKILAGITAVAISTATMGSVNAAAPGNDPAGTAPVTDSSAAGVDVADAGGNYLLRTLFAPRGIPATGSVRAPSAQGPNNWADGSWSQDFDRGSQGESFRDSIY